VPKETQRSWKSKKKRRQYEWEIDMTRGKRVKEVLEAVSRRSRKQIQRDLGFYYHPEAGAYDERDMLDNPMYPRAKKYRGLEKRLWNASATRHAIRRTKADQDQQSMGFDYAMRGRGLSKRQIKRAYKARAKREFGLRKQRRTERNGAKYYHQRREAHARAIARDVANGKNEWEIDLTRDELIEALVEHHLTEGEYWDAIKSGAKEGYALGSVGRHAGKTYMKMQKRKHGTLGAYARQLKDHSRKNLTQSTVKMMTTPQGQAHFKGQMNRVAKKLRGSKLPK
jgi:hypothetical protein